MQKNLCGTVIVVQQGIKKKIAVCREYEIPLCIFDVVVDNLASDCLLNFDAAIF